MGSENVCYLSENGNMHVNRKMKTGKPQRKDLLRLYTFYTALRKLDNRQRQVLFTYLSDEGAKAVFSCVYNGLCNWHVKCRKRLKEKLLKDKVALRYLINPKKDVSKRKKKLKQVGGALPLILASVIPLIADLIFRRK